MHTSIDALNWFLSRTNQIVWRAQRFRASRFLRALRRDGLVALFHQLRPEPVYLSEQVWRDFPEQVISGTLPKRMNGLVQELVARKLFVSDENIDADELAKTRASTLRLLNRPTILYLMMAQGCNFACTYCPIPTLAKRYGERLLSFEDAVAGINLWRKHIEDNPQDDEPYFMIFYGGEPLLNREVLERLLPYVSGEQSAGRLPKKPELMLCTNGSLVDGQLSKLCARYGVMVAVGVDGPQDHNDRIRITVDGERTFAEIERAIKQLVGDGVRVVASVTITPANVHRLAEYPAFLRKLGISQFGFNLMKGEALTRELAGGSAEEYCRVAARSVVQGLAEMTEDGHCYEYQLEKKLTALHNGLPFSIDCTCYGNQLVVQADGQVTNCPFLRFDQGHVRELPDSFRIGQAETVKAWRNRLPLFNDFIPADGVLDGGGCAWSSSELYGDALAQDNINTIFTKEVTHELIWTLLPREQADALLRGESAYWSYRRIGSL